MRFTGERVIPDIPELRTTYLQSRAAYDFAAARVDGMTVLDCGAGEGYGPALLAGAAGTVAGLDASVEAASFATEKYARVGNLCFVVGDAGALPFEDGSFDALCCFQVLEHLDNAAGFLFEAKRVLRPGGELILTTPNRLAAGTGPNPHHVLEYSAGELQDLLEIVFSRVEMLGVFGSERVLRYRARNRRLVQRLMWLDVFGLRYRLPERIRAPIHASLTRVIRRVVGKRNPEDVTGLEVDDFPIRTGDIGQAIDLLAIASASGDSDVEL